MEIYKIMQDKPVDKLANTFNNLALPLFTSMEPEPPKKTIAYAERNDAATIGKKQRPLIFCAFSEKIDLAQNAHTRFPPLLKLLFA